MLPYALLFHCVRTTKWHENCKSLQQLGRVAFHANNHTTQQWAWIRVWDMCKLPKL
jgi:hypothetical protein